jgi:thioredoxin 1
MKICYKFLMLAVLMGMFPSCTWFTGTKEVAPGGAQQVVEGKIVHIYTEGELTELEKNNPNLILDFYATWCGPCKVMENLFHEVMGDYDQLKIAKIDIDDSRSKALISKYNVGGVPHIFYIKDGQVKHQHVGYITKSELINIIKVHFGM